MKRSLFLATLLIIVACGPKKVATTPDAADYAPYIQAFTGGIVAADSPIRIDLAQNATTQAEEKLFLFKPAVEGTIKWDGPASVSFIPEEGALKPGQKYAVSFALDKVAPTPANLSSFNFGITVRKSAPVQQEEEPDNGRAFRVRSVQQQGDHIDVQLSESPVNAGTKGLIELKGATRSYIQVKDSLVQVFFEGRKEDMVLTLDGNLKDEKGNMLGQDFTRLFPLEEEKPAVEIPFKGNILPDKQRLLLPFKAVNLSAVEVRIVKIYAGNMLMFLQENELGGNSGLRRCGRLIYKGDIPLDTSKDLHHWNEFSIDLGSLMKQEPGALYRVRLSFRLDQSLYGGKEPPTMTRMGSSTPSRSDQECWDTPSPYYWDNDYNWAEYQWEDQDNPAKPSYYMDSDRFPSVQLMASDLGLMAEYAGGSTLWVAATDLITALPVPGADLEVYDYQLQCIGTGKTAGNGLAQVEVDRKPFAVVARAGGSVAYLRTVNGGERSLSRFEVGGQVVEEGLKAFVYGERGVWRPGDTMHLTMILMSKGKPLPEGHPATLELYTPEGRFYARKTVCGADGFYNFDLPTQADDPTGYWNAIIKAGGSSFHKTLHVETIKPNRLKIHTEYPSLLQAGQNIRIPVKAAWLSGSPAAGSTVHAQMTLKAQKGSPFKGFDKYSFVNPATQFKQADQELYKNRLNSVGEATVGLQLPEAQGAPGMLTAFIVTSVEEPGGDESFTTETLPFSPYSAYVGIRIPEDEYLETDRDHQLKVAVVDAAGKRVAGHNLEYRVFKTGWNWWWDATGADLDAYVSGRSVSVVSSGHLTSGTQDASIPFRVNYPDWGQYLLLVKDQQSGHISGRTFVADWPDYQGRAGRQDPESLTMLTFSTDKPKYQVGEKATVYLPAAAGGQALISLENASGVLHREWVATGAQDTPWNFTIQPSMAPNIYVHVTLLQPYGATANDLPLRLYGVQRIKVENPSSHLEPQMQLPTVIHPEETFTVKISEKNGKPMTYTLAVVDEGLLDLTAFKTPDPWNALYQPEALGVKTWDLYDRVVGAFSGRFSPLAAIGGDEDAIRSARKDNRFNPVVMYLPPKTLAGGSETLQLKLPMYVGSVRFMLVAGHDGAFGNAEKAVPVQSPLMVVTILPRVLGTGEEVAVPVNVFAMEEGLKEARITLQADGPVSLTGPHTQTVKFNGKADALVRFAMKALDQEGTAHISVQASGGQYKASEDIALQVRCPQPEVAVTERFELAPGTSRELEPGSLQLTAFPAPDACEMYRRMRDYPYNCGEQISARGLTLLHLLPLLPEEEAAQARSLLPTLVSQLYSRQSADGGFSYWSGGKSQPWVSSMAGLFLSEASARGIEVHAGVLRKWKSYQQKQSQQFRMATADPFDQLAEAFRLYSLGAAGSAYTSGMNRLREAGGLTVQARWVLASAYALCGKEAQATELLNGAMDQLTEYTPDPLTFGTPLRDRFLAIEALSRCHKIADALALARDVQDITHLSTQESAFAAMAWNALFKEVPQSSFMAQAGSATLRSQGAPVNYKVLAPETLTNPSDGVLIYGTHVSRSRSGTIKAASNGLRLEVKYTAPDGTAVHPESLPQGTRFKTVVTVSNIQPGMDMSHLALSLRIPSGWEIQNERLMGKEEDAGYDHLDIRDDRINWFFDLPAGTYKTFTVGLRAAYEGRYELPATVVEAMYQPAFNACTASAVATVRSE